MAAGQVGGGPICNLGAQFSPDGKYLLAGSAEAVRAYSTATGKRVAALHENVAAFCADPEKKTDVRIASYIMHMSGTKAMLFDCGKTICSEDFGFSI